MAANPTMTYIEQHAQALLIPKVTDVGTATRDPDALRAFIHLFRDVQIPDDVQEDAASREANVEAFYLADEPDEIKEVSIHLATVLSALAANTNAGYQPHATYGAELRNSILYRCSTTEKSAHPTKRDAPLCSPKTSVSTPLHLPLSTRLDEISLAPAGHIGVGFGPFDPPGAPRGPLQPSHLAQIF